MGSPLGEFIKSRLTELNLCQVELSIFSQIAKSQVNEIITGKRKLSAIQAIKMPLCLEIKPEQLLGIQTDQQLNILRNKTNNQLYGNTEQFKSNKK